jgi:hypothetical protein
MPAAATAPGPRWALRSADRTTQSPWIWTGDFVRPAWRDGRLTLLVLPAGPGVVAPFEVPNPTSCRAGHG